MTDDASPALVCLRTADLRKPRVASVQAACSQCGEPVWVAKSSPKAKSKICMPCAAPRMADANIANLTQKQIDDMISARKRRTLHG